MNKCSFCEKKFSSKYILKTHINTAKYCIENRATDTPKTVVIIFKCEGCKVELTSKQTLDNHKSKCVELINKKKDEEHAKNLLKKDEEHSKQIAILEKIILEKDQRIKDLESKLENIALKAVSRPNIINTNTDNRIQQTINNLIPITDEHLREQAQFLTLDHIKQGALGYANFACDYALKDRITCVDLSRRKIKYKNTEGQVVSDPEMTVISKKLFTAIQDKNSELVTQYKGQLRDMVLEKYRETGDIMTDEETRHLDVAIEQINKDMQEASNLYHQSKEIAHGQKPNMYHEFIKEVCNKTVS
jgi:hypothetical protein